MQPNGNAPVQPGNHHSPELPHHPEAELFGQQVRRHLDDASGKWSAYADPLKTEETNLSKWAGRNSTMPAWRLIRWTKVMGPGLLRWIFRMCGYDLVALPEVPLD